MRSANKVVLVGHLAADPEATTTATGRTRVTFPVATHRETTSDGERKDVTDYHPVVAWEKLGEICAKYLGRGQAVYVEGFILNRAYEQDGQRKFVTEVGGGGEHVHVDEKAWCRESHHRRPNARRVGSFRGES